MKAAGDQRDGFLPAVVGGDPRIRGIRVRFPFAHRGASQVQPTATLDALIDPPGEEVGRARWATACSTPRSARLAARRRRRGDADRLGGRDSARRYTRLGHSMPVFETEQLGDVKVSTPFLAVLENAAERPRSRQPYRLVHPSGWSGSLAANLERRKSVLVGAVRRRRRCGRRMAGRDQPSDRPLDCFGARPQA